MMNGYLILHVRFIYAVTEIDSVLISLCRVEMLCVWEMTTHVRLWALVLFRSEHMKGMMRTLTDVRHIPGMARNLISPSTLDVKGYKHSGSSGVLKVTKGSHIHMIGNMNSAQVICS